jgi:hypothetical protein
MIKMIAPCIAAGCTSVYKTNEWTPLSVCKMLTLLEKVRSGQPLPLPCHVRARVATINSATHPAE